MRKDSIKNIRINQEVLRELSVLIREVKDPRVSPFTSIVDVYVAPDLKTCKVWVSVLGDEEEQKNTLKGLNAAKGFLRYQLAHTVNLRNTPELFFVIDQTIEYGVNMSKKIDDVMASMPVRDDESSDETDGNEEISEE